MLAKEGKWLEDGMTLFCFGDSLTHSPTGYVKMLGDILAPRSIKVVNAGRGGDKTTWALTRLYQDVINLKPDAVSIFLGANDAAVGRGQWADEPRVTPETYGCNLRWIVHFCRLAGIARVSITPPLHRYEGEQYAEFGDIMVPYRAAAREAADDMRARFVPGDTAFEEEWARHPGHTGLLLTTDGVHLTEVGNRLLTETMMKAWEM